MNGRSGYVAVELALGLGLLVLPTALLALSLPGWVERQTVATAAAQEAARTVVIASSAEEGEGAARRLVAETAANSDLATGELTVCFVSHPVAAAAPDGCGRVRVERGLAVTAHVRVRLPAVTLPGFDASLGGIVRTVSHTEHVDRYRGLP